MKILVVDDHALVRQGMILALRERYPDAQVFEAHSLDDALDVSNRHDDLSVVLFDLHLGAGNGNGSGSQAGLRRMMETLGETPLIVISGSDEAGDVIESIRAGARGYVLKSGTTDLLEHAMSLVLSGETYMPLPRSILHRMGEPDVVEATNSQILGQLTERQRDVFQLLLSGFSNKEIARELGVLEGTVKVHVRAIMQKLGVRNRTQVAVVAARSGCFRERVS